jgi:hypothetical protein
MRLAIADPPYLGKSEMWYGAREMAALNVGGGINPAKKADVHPEAAEWDDPARHREMVERLIGEYDGWAIAMIPDNLFEYLAWVPRDVRIAVWHDPQVMPNGSHPRRRWEAVLLRRPAGRRRVIDVPMSVGDVLTCPHGKTDFAGRKPLAWTESCRCWATALRTTRLMTYSRARARCPLRYLRGDSLSASAPLTRKQPPTRETSTP